MNDFNPIIRDEFTGEFHGISGRFHAVTVSPRSKPGTFCKQTFGVSKSISNGRTIRMNIRFDDECNNGHNTFAITGEIYNPSIRGRDKIESCGCIHDDLAKHFPAIRPFLKWHLTSSDGPMHYISNTLYHASDCDHRGKRAGEPYAWQQAVSFGDNPIKHPLKDKFAAFLKDASTTGLAGKRFDFEVIQISEQKTSPVTGKLEYYHGWTFGGFASPWYECPFKSEQAALDFLKALQMFDVHFHAIPTLFSEGKERNLEAARDAAVWPDATDEQLCLPRDELKALLEARHASLMAEFRAMIEASGFLFERA